MTYRGFAVFSGVRGNSVVVRFSGSNPSLLWYRMLRRNLRCPGAVEAAVVAAPIYSVPKAHFLTSGTTLHGGVASVVASFALALPAVRAER
jgi:hypothetical protein